MKQETLDKALLYCYTELYNKATPQADFNKLLKEAELNERGQKIIKFEDYEIEDEVLEKVIQDTILKFKIKTDYLKESFRTAIYLGCSPKSKKN